MAEATDIPRWAEPLGERTWTRICELVDAGWGATAVHRELQLPDEKLRSLQQYVKSVGPRRRLTQFGKFKDALLEQIETFGAELVEALRVIAQVTVSDNTKAATRVRGMEAMTKFAQELRHMLAADEEAEKQSAKATDTTRQRDAQKRLSDEAIERIKAIYGLADDGGGDGTT